MKVNSYDINIYTPIWKKKNLITRGYMYLYFCMFDIDAYMGIDFLLLTLI